MNESHQPTEPLPSVPPQPPAAQPSQTDAGSFSASQTVASSSRRHDKRWWWRVAAVTTAALMVIAASVGVGMAMTGSSSPASPQATPAAGKPGAARHLKARKSGKKGKGAKIDAAKQAWAHRYGVDRSTMPNLAPVASASAAQQQAAAQLLQATEDATAKYADIAVAQAAGFDLQAALTRAEQKKPKLAAQLQRIDAGTMPKNGMMPMLHVPNQANRKDGKVLDPDAPETLMYEYLGKSQWKLIGVMYVANESYPQAPPDPAGPIMRWHYHDKSGGQSLMMHLFFVPGNDLAHAYAAEMS